MTVVMIAVLAAAVAALSVIQLRNRPRRPTSLRAAPRTRRILFPFVAYALSPRALDAALRLAKAEDAVLVPVFLCRVSLHLPLDTPLPRQSEIAIPLQEAIEHRAGDFEVPVDARIERGRTYRHALRQTMANERFDRIVIAASAHGEIGFDPEDVAWLLDSVPEAEIVVLRPSAEEQLGPPAPTPRGQSWTVRERAARARAARR